jgi:Rrf2 family nitric oxide-sensitive transcriptional repressor
MISQTSEYALRAVVFLAENEPGQTTIAIANATQVPAAYLSKVLQQLAKAGIVKSQRGIGGGFSMLKPPKKLTALDVVNAVDPIVRITKCPLNLEAHAIRLCTLHRRLDEATALMEKAFASTTIAELMTIPRGDNIYTFPLERKRKGKSRK